MGQEDSNIGSSVKNFVGNFFKELEEGLKERGLIMCPESECFAKMDLNAVVTGETQSGGGIKIMGIGGSLKGIKSDTQSQKITVFVKNVRKSDLEIENAKIAKAQAEIKVAENMMKQLR